MNQPPRRSATGITGWRKATASDLRTPAESSRRIKPHQLLVQTSSFSFSSLIECSDPSANTNTQQTSRSCDGGLNDVMPIRQNTAVHDPISLSVIPSIPAYFLP